MINFNGNLCQNHLAQNRGFLYADAVFDSFKIIAGQILFFEDHYFRLMSAMRMMRMQIPMTFTQEFIKNEVLKTLSSKNSSGQARMTVYRQTGGKYLPENNDVEYIIQFSEKNHSDYMIDDQLLYEVDLYNDFYISAQLLSTIKTTPKNINVLASIYANENDLDNCILLNDRKDVVEFTNGNLFLVFGNKIITPPISSGCLNGIIRKQLIKLLNKSTVFEFEERAISPFELQQADEMFLTNINVGIKPISQYRKKKYQQIKAKEVLENLNNHLVL